MTAQEESSMAEKILTDLECIIYGDDYLEEFSIIPTTENEKNKSPILYHEHHLGLELWCVKYVYNYAYNCLLKLKPFLQKKRLNMVVKEEMNKLLLGALLIKPEVLTFWNMRRELIERDVIDIHKELLIIKLILSSRCKSNETFAYRKWIISKLLKCENNNIDYKRQLLNNELTVTEIAASKSPNNYHAWTHRIWSIQAIGLKFLSTFLNIQLDFSLNWIFSHVSEHTGFHYRQYIINYVKHYPLDNEYMIKFYKQVYDHLGVNHSGSIGKFLLNDNFNITNINNEIDNFYCILLHELLITIDKINVTYPDHEAIWYHRRYVIYSLLNTSYELYKVPWVHKINLTEFLDVNENMTSVNLENSLDYKFQDNGELHAKLFKSENNAVENSRLYKFLIKTESEFIAEYCSTKYSSVQNFLAKRHQRWLRIILGLKDM